MFQAALSQVSHDQGNITSRCQEVFPNIARKVSSFTGSNQSASSGHPEATFAKFHELVGPPCLLQEN